MRRFTLLGICISGLWVVAFVIIIGANFQVALDMDLNEWGDFLAGFSAPLALLWLVIGFFQQGEELKLNTKALKAQQEELRQQVKETAFLARNADRQASATEALAKLTTTEQERAALKEQLEAQPAFTATHGRISNTGTYTNIENVGGDAFNPRLQYEGEKELELQSRRIWKAGGNATIVIRPPTKPEDYPFRFSIVCEDRLGATHSRSYKYIGDHDIREVQ